MIRLHPAEEHGLLETTDRPEIAFHRNPLPGGDHLRVGDREQLAAELGDLAPQASTVPSDGARLGRTRVGDGLTAGRPFSSPKRKTVSRH